MHIVGVSRGCEYSPNHVGNDAAIFNKVVERLQELGCQVDVYSEKEFVEKEIGGKVIFNMARDGATVVRLKQLEQDGALVINSAYGIDNCVRRPMTELLLAHGIPHPESFVLQLATDSFPGKHFPYWIKRGDSHAMVKEDVCYVTDAAEAEAVLSDFRARGIDSAVVNEHLRGDLVKFYGVSGSDFFYWFYPSPCSHSKFGLEVINGEAQGFSFDEAELRCVCHQAAEILHVPVYGGDCIIAPDGTFRIIDFNDWPSFARCREEAGLKIAAYIYEQARNKRDYDE